jgi:hypothetical protein
MQFVRRIGHCRFSFCPLRQVKVLVILLVVLLAFSGNSYAASRDSQTTLHISVTLVTTIATGLAEPVERTQVASSDQGIVYNLRPDAEHNVTEAVINTTRAKPLEQAPTNRNDSPKDESIVVSTVVMK